jgi:hypothetical protein
MLEGNQARWIWDNFEPDPKDDFAVWLMDPAEWQALEAARSAGQANPEDGQAWLNLANVYRALATTGRNSPSVFSSSYREPGLEAYRKAAELLPEHPVPHTGLALLLLSAGKEASPETLQAVRKEIDIARALEENDPSLAEGAGLSYLLAEDALSMVLYNEATATAEAAYGAAGQAAQTPTAPPAGSPFPATAVAQAVTPAAELSPSLTPQPKPGATLSPSPTVATFQPFLSPSGFGLTGCLVLAGMLVFLGLLLFLAVRTTRK